jgi:hypothetical protein
MTFPNFVSGEVLRAQDMNAVSGWLVKTQTIGAGVGTVVVTDAFSTDYENYLVQIVGGVASTEVALTLALTGSATGYYGGLMVVTYTTGAVSGGGVNNGASWTYAGTANTTGIAMNATLLGPFLAKNTVIQAGYAAPSGTAGGVFNGYHASAASYTGFTLGVAGTLTGGTIRVYGFKK